MSCVRGSLLYGFSQPTSLLGWLTAQGTEHAAENGQAFLRLFRHLGVLARVESNPKDLAILLKSSID
jgi:hypothetical protein